MGLLLTGLGAATGALGNTQAARTSTSNMTSGGSQTSSGGTRRYLAPEQSDLLGQLKQRATGQMANPGAGLAPFRAAAANSINATSGATEPTIRARFLGSGAQRSGKYGRAQRLTETSRLGKIADVDNQVGQMALQRGDEASQLMERLLGINLGSDTSGSASTSGFQNGTQVGAGSALAGGLGGGLSTFQALMNQLLASGGGF
jgi:hypothetical protein